MTTRRELAVILSVALLAAVAAHLPLWGQLGAAIPGEAGSDTYRGHWSLWLMGAELFDWTFSTARVHFPTGVSLLPFPAFTLMLAAPLSRLLGPDIALPLIVGGHSALAVVGGWALVRALGGRLGGGLLAGALIASQPVLGGALRDGTLEVLAVGWMPLCLAAFARACAGSWRMGLAAGGVFLVICLESVYYASFTSLAVLAALTTIRDRRGLVGAGVAGVVVALGAAILAWRFGPIAHNIAEVMASTGDDLAQVRAANAASLSELRYLATHPGGLGWILGAIYAPPLAHWVAFLVLGFAALRRSWWLLILGALYTLLATLHPAVAWWDGSPLGEPIRFPRRYLASAGVVLGAAAGVGLSQVAEIAHRRGLRWRWLEPVAGGALALYLGIWGLHAGGLMSAYPLVTLPEVAFADAIAADCDDCAVLFMPLEIPGGTTQHRHEAPVFADLHQDIASSDHLFLQTRAGASVWTAPALLTLMEHDRAALQLPKNLTDLAFEAAGQSVPGSAMRPAEDYAEELAYLMGQGLQYVAVDDARYQGEGGDFFRGLMEAWAVSSRRFEDGTGVTLYKLYDQRPAPIPAPEPLVEPSQSGEIFGGRVVGLPAGAEIAWVVAAVGDDERRCPVEMAEGTFQCLGVFSVDRVWLEIDGAVVEVARDETQRARTRLVIR